MFIPAVLAFALAAQSPTIADIEVFGARKVPKEKILKAVGAKPGDALPPSKPQLEEALLAVDGVARVNVEAVCCEAGGAILYVGIEERGQPGFAVRDYPQGEMQLPEEIVDAYRDFSVALAAALRQGDTREDVSQGHSLMNNIACRAIQTRFTGFANAYLDILKAVAREAGDEEQRAVAVYVLGYAERKQDVTAELQLALRDPDPGVRANALRALAPIAEFARKDPERGIKVEPTWFIEMLNSTILGDRLSGAKALLQMSDEGMSESMEAQLRERGLASLQEMAHWHRLENALPGYLLLGRLAGYQDKELQTAWASADRDAKLQEIEKKLKSKK